MPAPVLDPQALIELFTTASEKQTAQLRAAVGEATLRALEGREMTLKNIRAAIKSVTEAASQGAAQNLTPQVDVEALLTSAVSGMDDALLQAVEAHRVALERFVSQGVGIKEEALQKALDDLEKFESTLFGAVRKAAGQAPESLTGAWTQALGQFPKGSSAAGAQATATVDSITQQMELALRNTRSAGLKAAQTLAQSYTALVSGVLIGLSDALRRNAEAAAAAAAQAPAKPAAKTSRRKAS